MEYLNEGKHLTTSDTTIITSGASTKILIKTIHATNITSSEVTNARTLLEKILRLK